MKILITLVVTITSHISGGLGTGGSSSVFSAYSIPGFQTMEACEKAKSGEVLRMSGAVGISGRVKGECVEYRGGQ